MLLQLGPDRTEDIDRRLACTLAAVAGALNATAFYSVGFFSANMTGNVSSLSDQIALGQWRTATFYACVVIIFILGSTSSTLLISAGRRRGNRGIYAQTILCEAVLLASLAMVMVWIPQKLRVPCMVWGLAFLMGLQNAVVTRISEARVRTTHISGMATDIGIELALLLDIARRSEPAQSMGDVGDRLRLHAATVVSFLSGGIIGLLLYRLVDGVTLWIAAAALVAISLPAVFRAKRENAASRAFANDL